MFIASNDRTQSVIIKERGQEVGRDLLEGPNGSHRDIGVDRQDHNIFNT